MIYKEFMEKIQDDKLQPSYLFLGVEEYIMSTAIEILKDRYIEEAFEALNFTRLEGKDILLEDLMNACETLPFMSKKKIVILRDINAFLGNINDSVEKDFYNYLESLEDYLVLILLDNTSSVKKNMKIYKFFNKDQRAVEFMKLQNNDLIHWINSILNKYNKEMRISEINYFINRTSYRSKNINQNLFDIENELLKIINYSKIQLITKEDIDNVLINPMDTNIFELLNAINRRDTEEAINIFNEMYISNEPIPKIFHMITRQIRLILSYKLHKDTFTSDRDIQEELKIKNYEFNKIRTQSNKFEIKQLESIMEYLLLMDLKLKTVSNDYRLEMEILLVKLCK